MNVSIDFAWRARGHLCQRQGSCRQRDLTLFPSRCFSKIKAIVSNSPVAMLVRALSLVALYFKIRLYLLRVRLQMTKRAQSEVDLTYITPRVIAMSFPASGYECGALERARAARTQAPNADANTDRRIVVVVVWLRFFRACKIESRRSMGRHVATGACSVPQRH